MFKRIVLTLAIVGAFAIGAGTPNTASADRGHHHRHHHGHWHGHGHGHWHGHYRGPIVYPPIIYGGYYPARYYYADPYYYGRPYGYYGHYGSGVSVSFGW